MGIRNALKGKTTFYFFSGKGGVGKTSISASVALSLARKGKKVLIISTDPAHSLSDSLRMKIGGEIKKVEDNLFAVEIDPKKAMAEYKEKISLQLDKIESLKGLGIEDMVGMADMSPGIDEVAAFDKFLQYMNSKDYDNIVFDTAPTGHTLRFLSLPEVLDSWVGKIIMIRMKFAGVINTFKKLLPFGGDSEQPGIDTDQLEEMKKRIQDAKEIMKDQKRTNFWLVSIAEQMSILESERAANALDGYGIKISGIVVNQLLPEKSNCEFCSARRGMQMRNLADLCKRFSGLPIKKIPLYSHEVHGLVHLEKMGKEFFR
ncbi:MAG: TRC40/GET3/ArsA family transport-energizing ATPase [Candidatus Aenigmatarchaeota archaeon]